ncbi:MAG TPA: hypothetical protein VG734_24885 [Lacunisphaera sp.]|nr:hypothetical protein [Lacunisphaera sp.]
MPYLIVLIIGVPLVIGISILMVRAGVRRGGSSDTSTGYVPCVTDGGDSHPSHHGNGHSKDGGNVSGSSSDSGGGGDLGGGGDGGGGGSD